MPLRITTSHQSDRLGPCCRLQSFFLALMLCMFGAGVSLGNVRYVGQVLPVPDPNEDDGSSITNEDVEVGRDLAGGIFIDFTITLSNPPTFAPNPVSSLSANLGVERDGIGRVEITDNGWFLTNGNPDALIVGDQGVGYLDLFTSALVDLNTDPNGGGPTTSGMIVGNAVTGQGQVTINTIASRIESNSLVVGNEGFGSILLTDTGSLVSTTSSVGSMLTGQGSVTLNDATRWDLRDQLLVGDEGVGDVVLNGSSNIIAVPLATDPNLVVVGRDETGHGSVTLNDSSRFFLDGGIVVGGEGFGTVTLNAASRLISDEGTIGRGNASTGHVVLNGTSRWDVRGDLGIGLEAGGDPNASNAVGTLSINRSVEQDLPAVVQVEADADITVGRRGEINMGGGTLKHLPSTGSPIPIQNYGLIRGKGTIDALLDINASGELRNAADLANQREKLLVTLEVDVAGDGNATYDTADGLIESQGGEMEFHDLVTNNGTIVARDAIMRFKGSEINTLLAFDLVNNGLITLLDDTTLYGTIDNSAGTITIDLAGTPTVVPTIFGDIVFTQSPIVAAITEGGPEVAAISSAAGGLQFTVDEEPGVLSVYGEIELDPFSSILDLNYASSVASQPGDTFTVATATNITGDFFNSQVEADGYLWDIIVDDVAGEIRVMNTGMLASGILGDFNGDGVVDGADFLLWQRNPSVGDLADWTANYGSPTTSNVTTVPEPSTFLMSLAILTLRFRRRD